MTLEDNTIPDTTAPGFGPDTGVIMAARDSHLAGGFTPNWAAGTRAAAIAEQYLGWYESDLERLGITQAGVPTDESCANFVSAMLQRAGAITWHCVNVDNLIAGLRRQGWIQIATHDAAPGDVWIRPAPYERQHTELVAANNRGRITLIGSNNHPNPNNQQINYDTYSANIPGTYILAPRW